MPPRPVDAFPLLSVRQRGFTLIELIMVMVVVGILAVFVAPSLFDAGVFRSRGFADQVQASLRYAQKVAIAQRRFVCVAFDTGADPDTMTLTTGATAGCGAALQSPTGDPAYVVNAPANTTFAAVPANFSFDPQGSPSFAVTSTVTVTDAANPITIEAETGYVH